MNTDQRAFTVGYFMGCMSAIRELTSLPIDEEAIATLLVQFLKVIKEPTLTADERDSWLIAMNKVKEYIHTDLMKDMIPK